MSMCSLFLLPATLRRAHTHHKDKSDNCGGTSCLNMGEGVRDGIVLLRGSCMHSDFAVFFFK